MLLFSIFNNREYFSLTRGILRFRLAGSYGERLSKHCRKIFFTPQQH